MQYSYTRALASHDPAEIEFEIHRIRRMMRPCGWKSEKCAPLYRRLQIIATDETADGAASLSNTD
jgi:hypothetical protein